MNVEELEERLDKYTAIALSELCGQIDLTNLSKGNAEEIGEVAGKIAAAALLTGIKLLDDSHEKGKEE